ncbi:YbaN family protein [bacterium]|nr:YbaN family protein [bacterium]
MIRTDPAVRPHRNRLVRGLLIVAGTILVGIGIAGMFLPLLPTTIFLLGAAACYARASDRFYDRLLANRLCGPFIREWREHRTVPRRARLTALLLIVTTFSTSITFFVPGILWRVIVAAVGVGVFSIVWRLPVREPVEPIPAPAPATRGH